MSQFHTILIFKFKAIKNFIRTRLDLLTRIEIILFTGFLFFYILHLFHARFAGTSEKDGLEFIWSFYIFVIRIVLILLFTGGFLTAKKRIGAFQNEVLFSLPVTQLDFAKSKIWDLSVPFSLLYPFWIVLYFIFARSIKTSVSESVLLALALTGAYFFVLYAAITVFLLLFKMKNLFFRHVIAGSFIFMLFVLFIIYAEKIRIHVFQYLYGAGLPVLAVCIFILTVRILAAKAIRQPEHLLSLPEKPRYKSVGKLLGFYLIFTPGRIKAIVKKDCLYILRNYKIFVFYILLSLIVLTVGILKLTVIHEGIQWFLSIIIATAYLVANASFKLNENNVENLFVIKNQPISARRFWLAKFWNGFLPVLWLIVFGLLIIIFKFGFNFQLIIPSTLAVLFIAFTLLFLQTNFALYSYPYTSYAILWFNLYIIIAITFFTIFLFPPLTAGFLLFGYAAIFRVFKRFKTVDILND